MSNFNGNQKLEESIFTALNYALWNRHDLEHGFTPFMMLSKNGEKRIRRVVTMGDPYALFRQMLSEENEVYDQIVLCSEGKVTFSDGKQDAILVKGFDTSEPKGFFLIQKFRGIESGNGFAVLGNAIIYKEEELITALVEREDDKKVEAPFISGMKVSAQDHQFKRIIIAGHNSASTLANVLFNTVVNILLQNEPDFSGDIEIKFVPDTVRSGEFEKFIFTQLAEKIKRSKWAMDWEEAFSKELLIEFTYEDPEPAIAGRVDYSALSVEELNLEFKKIVKEFEKRGIPYPDTGYSG